MRDRDPVRAARLAELAAEIAVGLGLDRLEVRADAFGAGTARAHGARGLTVGGVVHIDPTALDAARGDGVELLVHEAVHVAQGRLAGAPQPERAEAEAALLAREFVRTGALSVPRQPIAAAHAARDEEKGAPAHVDAILAHPIPMEVHAQMVGLVVRPVEAGAEWVAGLHLGEQFLAGLLQRLVGEAYSVELLRAAQAILEARSSSFAGALRGHASEKDRAIGHRYFVPARAALALVHWLETERGLAVALTREQRSTLVGARAAADAWPWIRALGTYPAWYGEALFRHQAASQASVLERFRDAEDRRREAGQSDVNVDQESPTLDAARDLLAAIVVPALAVDAIRTDAELASHPEYRALWNHAPGGAQAAIAPERSAIDLERAAILLDHAAQGSVSAAMLDRPEARRRALEVLPAIQRERGPALDGGDEKLVDASAMATVPPVPSWLSAYPQLAPPLYDAAAGASRTFAMTLHYPDDLEAIGAHLGNHFKFELIRIPDDDVKRVEATAKDDEVEGESPSWGEVYRQRLGRRVRYAAADIDRVRAVGGLEDQLGSIGEGAATLGAATSHAVAGIGEVVKTFLAQLFEPVSECTFALERPGLHVVRSTVTTDPGEQATWVRAPSVAWVPLWVRPPAEMAEARAELELESQAGNRARLAMIEEELARADLDQASRALLLDEKERLAIALGGSLEALLQLERDQLAAQLREQGGASPPIGARIADIDAILATRATRLGEHRPDASLGLEPPFRLPATFVSDDGVPAQLALELVQQPAPDGRWRYYVSDSTSRVGGDQTGPEAAGRADAIREAVRALLEEPDRYGRGHCAILVPSAPGFAGGETRSMTLRVDADGAAIAMQAVGNVTTALSIALVAAAPFVGAGALVLMLPVGVIGAVPSAYRLADRASSHTLEMDISAAMDIVDVLGSAAGLGQLGARGRWVHGALMVTGMGADGLGFALAGARFVDDLSRIDPNAPPGLRRAMIMELVAGQLMTAGIQAGGTLLGRAQAARAQAGLGRREAHLPLAGSNLHDALRHALGRDEGAGGPLVFVDDKLGASVEIAHHLDGYGLPVDVHLRVGPAASPDAVAAKAPLLAALDRLASAEQTIRHLIDRVHTLDAARPDRLALHHTILALPERLRDLHERARLGTLSPDAAAAELAHLQRDLDHHVTALSGAPLLSDTAGLGRTTTDSDGAAAAKAYATEGSGSLLAHATEKRTRSLADALLAIMYGERTGEMPRFLARADTETSVQNYGTFGNATKPFIFAGEPADLRGLSRPEVMLKVGWPRSWIEKNIGEELVIVIFDTNPKKLASGAPDVEVGPVGWADIEREALKNDEFVRLAEADYGISTRELPELFAVAARSPIRGAPATTDPAIAAKVDGLRELLAKSYSVSDLFTGINMTMEEGGQLGARELMVVRKNDTSFKLLPDNHIVVHLGRVTQADIDSLFPRNPESSP